MKTENDIAISVHDLYKSFRLPHETHNGIKQLIVNSWKRKKGYEVQQVLNGVDFEIKKGEFFGIVGRNGSGKSTLLKCMAGIYAPDKGSVKVNGTLTPFIELGVGFNPELTGRENVYLNGALLGFSNDEMEKMYDEIVKFAELERFMDQKLKNYSSGMQVRLAFSIAIRAQGDILLLDEVLAVGDSAFQRKCFEYFAQLKRNRKTVILVTHSMDNVMQFCTKALLLDEGRIQVLGNPTTVAKAYTKLNRPEDTQDSSIEETENEVFGVKLKAHEVNLYRSTNESTHILTGEDEYLKLSIKLVPEKVIHDAFVAFTIRRTTGELMYWYSSEFNYPHWTIDTEKGVQISAEIQNVFGEGSYEVGVFIKSMDRTKDYLEMEPAYKFEIVDRGMNGYMLHPQAKINVS